MHLDAFLNIKIFIKLLLSTKLLLHCTEQKIIMLNEPLLKFYFHITFARKTKIYIQTSDIIKFNKAKSKTKHKNEKKKFYNLRLITRRIQKNGENNCSFF